MPVTSVSITRLVYEHPLGRSYNLRVLDLSQPTYLTYSPNRQESYNCSGPLVGELGFEYNGHHHRCICHAAQRAIPVATNVQSATLEVTSMRFGPTTVRTRVTWTTTYKLENGQLRAGRYSLSGGVPLFYPVDVATERCVGTMATVLVRIAFRNAARIAKCVSPMEDTVPILGSLDEPEIDSRYPRVRITLDQINPAARDLTSQTLWNINQLEETLRKCRFN